MNSLKVRAAKIFLRLALAASYLSAVADRFGYWGPAGKQGVAWGNFENFISYTATLNWFVPESLVPYLAWAATGLEVVLAVLLMLGIKLRETALVSGALLSSFFITMTIAGGPKGPLDYNVFTAAAACFLLYCTTDRKS